MKKKLTKYEYKRILSHELYKNSKKGKRGTGGDMLNAVNTRLTDGAYIEMMDMIEMIGVSRSNFVRYAILQAMEEVKNKIAEHEEKE